MSQPQPSVLLPSGRSQLSVGGSRVQDIIREDELVTSRVISESQSDTQRVDNDTVIPTPQQPRMYPSAQHYIAEPNEPSRIQIRLVSAELARSHASAVRNGASATDIEGALAFEGEFISGNTSLVNIFTPGCSRACSDASSLSMLSDVKSLGCLDGSQKMP